MNLKILHLLWDGDLGGVQRYVLNILKNGTWENCTHSVCCFSSVGRILNSQTLSEIPITELGLKRGWSISARRRLNLLINSNNFDVIHSHCDTPALLLNLGLLNNSRLIYTEHGDTILRESRSWFTFLLWKYYGGYWDKLIMNSSLIKKDFLSRFPYLEKKTVICPNPLIEVIGVKKRELRSAKNYQVGVFGRLVHQKGIDRVFEIAKKVCKTFPDVNFNVFGDGSLLKILQKECRRLNLTKTVLFRGYTKEPLLMMSEMDCNIVPSRIEPFGLVALEALSVGTPVVGFYDSGVAEIVEDKKCGRLVGNGDLTQMSEAVVEILSDKKKWSEMSFNAISHSRNDFRLSKHCNKLQEIYENSLEKG